MNDLTRLEQLAEDILARMRLHPLKEVKLATLARRHRTDLASVDTALQTLRAWGYRFRTRKGTTRFVSAPDLLTATEISYRLKTRFIGQTIHAFQSVKSTNDLAAELAAAGAPEGTIVCAERQTKGRGRFQRQWHSPDAAGIYCSIILRPAFAPERAPGLSIMTALALAECLRELCPDRVGIKWPNDVLISGKKTAGILTETATTGGCIEHVVVGVGINVNHTMDDFPEELRPIATSLRRALRRKQSRGELLKAFLHRLEKEYLRYQKAGLKPARSRLRYYATLIGECVALTDGRRVVEGIARDIDANGGLILDTPNGEIVVSSGEISVVKK